MAAAMAKAATTMTVGFDLLGWCNGSGKDDCWVLPVGMGVECVPVF